MNADDVQLVRKGALAVRVLDARSGQPLSGAAVQVIPSIRAERSPVPPPPPGSGHAAALTGQDGAVQVPATLGSQFTVCASLDGYAAAAPMEVRAGTVSSPARVDLNLHVDGQLTVAVLDRAGDPLEGCIVEVVGDRSDPRTRLELTGTLERERTARTDALGRATLEGFWEGPHHVRAIPSDRASSPWTSVLVSEGRTTEAQIQLPSPQKESENL